MALGQKACRLKKKIEAAPFLLSEIERFVNLKSRAREGKIERFRKPGKGHRQRKEFR
jgi:hypothetical protein